MKQPSRQPVHRFITSASSSAGYPKLFGKRNELLPEVALVGRSNVGKSSCLNTLFGVRSLAKTSSTPGKTQLINFFSYNEEFIVTDLPGYGYAKLPKEQKEAWGAMMEEYLTERESLKLVLLLFDARRGMQEEELNFLSWSLSHNRDVIAVATKVDSCNQSQLAKLRATKIPYGNVPIYPFSAKDGTGKNALLAAITATLSA